VVKRSVFLTVASGTAAALAVAAAGPADAAANGFSFDRAAFEAVLARPARHKQVFGTARLGGGVVLHYMQNSLNAYRDGFGEGPGTLHVAAVFYGTSLAAVCPDGLWNSFSLETYLARSGEAFDQGTRGVNPYASQVAALRAAGASFFVCNNQLGEFSQALANAPEGASSDPDTIYAQFAGTLRKEPAVMLVPAGVAALNAAQEAHFTLLQATLK
jgi:intracellular sulfur oxidation DsrE/DsrF family protein